MLKASLLSAAILLAASGLAHAGGQPGSIGVGAEFQLNPFVDGVSLNYDAGQFHVGGSLGFDDPEGADNTVFTIGGHFFYHVHSTAMADFSVGGNIGILSAPEGAASDDRITGLFLEPALQIRLFVASNVALSFTGGLVIGLVDAEGAAVTGQGAGVNGGAGVHYYFF